MIRRGITLIEILVAIGIIGLLLGLTLPAIQKIRDAALRSSSMNNMRQINLAFHSYVDQDGKLPAFANVAEFGPFMVLYPHLERNRRVFISPADPSLHFINPNNVFYPPIDPDDLLSSYAYNAKVFQEKRTLENGIGDGTSNTMSMTEHYSRCAGPKWVVFIFSLQHSSGSGGLRRPSFADMYYGDVVPITINSKTTPSVVGVTFQLAPKVMESDATMPQTPHSGGILVGMMDGSVRTIGKGVRDEVFWSAVTPNGGEVSGDL